MQIEIIYTMLDHTTITKNIKVDSVKDIMKEVFINIDINKTRMVLVNNDKGIEIYKQYL